jgi:transcriptional regulator with XRE-family HTH domain
MVITKTRGHLRRLIFDSSDLSPTSNRHISKSKLAGRNGFNLVGAPLGDLAVPHAHGFSAYAESVTERLMGTTEVFENVVEQDHGASVSLLPTSVKRLTHERKLPKGKLPYMSRKPKDEWSIKRGAAMKAARLTLGHSQQKIADLADIADRETISQYESGAILDIDPAVIPRLAKALGIAAQALSRTPLEVHDEGASLKVSPVARSIALNWDGYPQILQNHIRHLLASYDKVAKEFGPEAATAMYTTTLPPPALPHGNVIPIQEKKRKAQR